jgi:hypothetical protein
MKHTDYACQGPYIKSWMEGAASWHPSVIGHRLRASHHSYFWLVVLRDAIQELIKLASHRAIDAISKDIDKHLNHYYPKGKLPAPAHLSPFSDDMQCFTDYEPRSMRNSTLINQVVSGLSSDGKLTSGWVIYIHSEILEFIY